MQNYFVSVSSRDYAGLEVLGIMSASKVHILMAEALAMLIETQSIEGAMPTLLSRLKQHTSLGRHGWNSRSTSWLAFSLASSFLAMVEALVLRIESISIEGDGMGHIALITLNLTSYYYTTTRWSKTRPTSLDRRGQKPGVVEGNKEKDEVLRMIVSFLAYKVCHISGKKRC